MRTVEQTTNFEEKKIVKQDESNGDSKFIAVTGFGGKLLSFEG